MAYYLYKTSDLKTKLTLQNFNGLIQRNLVPQKLDFEKRVYNFNKYLKEYKKGIYYFFNDIALEFYNKYFSLDELEVIQGTTCIKQNTWDKTYQKVMDAARDWLKENQQEVLKLLNKNIFAQNWDKYAKGSISKWEMDSMCFYYHEHELANVDNDYYGFVDFFRLPEEPEIDYYWKRNGKQIPIFKTYKIIGTVIGKDDNKATISLLTTTGVVTVKFTKEYYAIFKKQISEVQNDGSKKIIERSWFSRGTKIMLTGFRREETFVTKSYKHTPTHQIYRITQINKDGTIEFTHNRAGGESEDDNDN
jgi:DNA polymerase-3 subunit alpha